MNIKIILAICLGVFSGVIGGLLGIGGTLLLPGMILLNLVPDFKTAVGTVSFTFMLPLTLLAVIEFRKQLKVDFTIGLVLFFSYFFSAYFGAIMNKQFETKTLQYATSFIFLIVAIYFFYSAYNMK